MKINVSVTGKNLEAAFAGESMAHMKYRYFAKLAREMGDEETARAFEETMNQEIAHALGHLDRSAIHAGRREDAASVRLLSVRALESEHRRVPRGAEGRGPARRSASYDRAGTDGRERARVDAPSRRVGARSHENAPSVFSHRFARPSGHTRAEAAQGVVHCRARAPWFHAACAHIETSLTSMLRLDARPPPRARSRSRDGARA